MIFPFFADKISSGMQQTNLTRPASPARPVEPCKLRLHGLQGRHQLGRKISDKANQVNSFHAVEKRDSRLFKKAQMQGARKNRRAEAYLLIRWSEAM
jgi:hypothetical protein